MVIGVGECEGQSTPKGEEVGRYRKAKLYALMGLSDGFGQGITWVKQLVTLDVFCQEGNLLPRN